MTIFKHSLPRAVAVSFGLLTLLGLLLAPSLSDLLSDWASFLAAVALLLGVLNLLSIHVRRLVSGNLYSATLAIGMVVVFALAATDDQGLTTRGVLGVFEQIQVPLEAAMASLLAFFLLFAGFRLLQRRRNGWTVLFLASVIVVMLGHTALPTGLADTVGWLSDAVELVIANAGMRGILIGVALGTIVVGLQLLTTADRPYEK